MTIDEQRLPKARLLREFGISVPFSSVKKVGQVDTIKNLAVVRLPNKRKREVLRFIRRVRSDYQANRIP